MIPDAIHERVEATLPPAPEAVAKKAEPARYDTSRFMDDLMAAAWKPRVRTTVLALVKVLDALEKADAANSGYLLDQQLGVLLRLMRGQS